MSRPGRQKSDFGAGTAYGLGGHAYSSPSVDIPEDLGTLTVCYSLQDHSMRICNHDRAYLHRTYSRKEFTDRHPIIQSRTIYDPVCALQWFKNKTSRRPN